MVARKTLPASVVRALSGADLEAGQGIGLLLAVNGGGVPKVAALGVGEVLATAVDRVNLCLHQSSRTCAELTDRGRGLLMLVDRGRILKIDLKVDDVGDRVVLELPVRLFRGRVREVRVDEVGYATDVTLLGHRLVDPDDVLVRWRAQLELLREL